MFIKSSARLLAAAALALAAVPAAAVQFIVTFNGTSPILNINDFRSDLAGVGLTALTTNGTIAVDGRSRVTYYYLASESRQVDSFTDTNGSFGSYDEFNATDFGAPKLIGSVIYNSAGAIGAQFSDGGLAVPGDEAFGIFLPSLSTTSTYNTSSVYFGYDDKLTDRDDNHDDFIIRADISVVPEPTTWALLITGFGMVGYAARRRNKATVVSA